MHYNKYGFISEISGAIFMGCMLVFFLIFSNFGDKDDFLLNNIESNKVGIYMESIFFEKEGYKVGVLNIPGLGLEQNIEYNAVCDKSTEECWRVIGFIEKGNAFYGYDGESFFIFSLNSVSVYSGFELDALSEEKQQLLLSLKENPRFIFE